MLNRTIDKRARAADRERQRRRRARQRNKQAIYRVIADGDVLNFLVKWRWLRDGDTTNAELVGDAISRLLADSAQK
jgi:hypothetical protein